MLVLGGGSNLVVADDGFPARSSRSPPACRSGRRGRVSCGECWSPSRPANLGRTSWRSPSSARVRLEALSGIPGSVGATPIQNVGAYGQEVAQTIASVRVWDRRLRGVRTFASADCGFGYRTSRFKQDRVDAFGGRHVVLSVTFQFRQGSLGTPVAYAELARALGGEHGERAPQADVRRAVLAVRAGKGMVLDAADHDTWSAGSFFTNPVVAAGVVPDGAPAWPQPDGRVKTSAAWLIEHAGYAKGDAAGPAALSGKHTLALTNRGGATTADLLALAARGGDGVEDASASSRQRAGAGRCEL